MSRSRGRAPRDVDTPVERLIALDLSRDDRADLHERDVGEIETQLDGPVSLRVHPARGLVHLGILAP